MDRLDDGSDVYADLNPLSSVITQPSYMDSKAPVSVSLASLFSMDQPLFNPPIIPMESSTEQFLLQNPLPDDPTLMTSTRGSNKTTSANGLPKMESLTPIEIPPARLSSSRNKRKSPTEKSAKSLPVTSPKYQAKSIKAQTESFDSVRSKFRDSLASALILSAVKQDGPPVVEGVGDDLLQGNGLSWEADVDSVEKSTVLAAAVEAELFRLFGGVNKKYKEKARSLLFNLKDPSNPELRTRVCSGEITPERLCSMSAEELASKELSEWRMAKAEEFAHMVVLQEDVDLRKVVKKTHKGEVQVEVEDDTTSVEVAVGANSLPLVLAKAKAKDDKAKAAVNEKANGDGPQDIQELMADGREAETLPPIVSLDEFMEALDSEPPFENMAAESSRLDSLPNTKVAKNSLNSPILSKTENIESTKVGDGEEQKSVDFMPPVVTLEEYIWEGAIQLTVSSAVTVKAFFKSGEKASTNDWPAVMEVKGRVRLEAFEKFLRDLPLSKSRAMTVIYFQWKEGSPEGGRKAISEAAESYAADGRLGYVEPCPGVELYVCPPGGTTSKLVPAAGEPPAPPDSLVGVVVWRRAFVLSPRPQKPSSKNKQLPPLSHKNPKNPPSLQQRREDEEALVDDVPPGFGPPPSREEDDLPEFDFQKSSSSSSSALQMRELIHKYGSHTAPANPSRALWEDDDDIPEWKPQMFAPPVPPAAPPLQLAQFLPGPAVQPVGWPPYGFVAGDGRGAMDWRYDVNKSRGV